MRETLKIKLKNLTQQPGCYLMKDKNGKIIYVGKAKDLKSRVNSYFTGAHNYKTTKMVANIHDFDTIVTKTEKESLILELNLIKQHQPRYNILFMDDKVYPYIKITDEVYPRLTISRNRKKYKNAKVFGPYPDSSAARNMIRLLGRLYPTRKCSHLNKEFCLYYHMGQCLGMCGQVVDPKEYAKVIDDVEKILKGDTRALIVKNEKLQTQYIEEMKFEQAANIQEILNALHHISNKQEVQVNDTKLNVDVFNYYVHNGYSAIVIVEVRSGKVLNTKKFLTPLYEEPDTALVHYMNQYYQVHPLSKEIIVPNILDENLYTKEVYDRLFVPQRGTKVRFIEMSKNNAKHYLEEQFNLINTLPEKIEAATMQLDELLKSSISTIEMFDISHISGSNNVAGMISFKEGLPDKNEYRLFRLEDHLSDFDSMKEVIYRRYFRLLKDGLQMPDLIIVDGGEAQITAAHNILKSLNLNIKLIGLKKDEHHNTSAIVTSDHEQLEIDKSSELFFFLSRMQDEVHRYAINYHKKLRSKSQTRSILDDIPGVGAARKAELLSTFKNIENIKKASLEELCKVVPLKIAENIKQVLVE